MTEYEIYQLKFTPENKDIAFRSMSELNKANVQVDRDNYDCVYRGRAEQDISLDEIYEIFNLDNRPNAKDMHSVSISDVIVLHEEGTAKAYYVDRIGFAEIPNFLSEIREYIPVYTETRDHAILNEEQEPYKISRKENIRCKNAIERSIRDHFDGMHLAPESVKTVIEEFGVDRTAWVLANTLKMKHFDGRFSRQHKEWAETIPVQRETDPWGNLLNYDYTVDSHPAVLDGFIGMARNEMKKLRQPEKEQVPAAKERSSVRAALREKQQEVKARTEAPEKVAAIKKSREALE